MRYFLSFASKNETGYIISLYKLPSQKHDKSYMILLLGIHFLFSQPAISILEQQNGGEMIWPTLKVLKSIQLLVLMVVVRILPNSYLCIDLIFINQPNLVIESGVHPFLHLNFHDQIVFATLNLKIEYRSIYGRLIWYYKSINEQMINHAIKNFNWDRWLEGKNVHDQVCLFNPLVFGVHWKVTYT